MIIIKFEDLLDNPYRELNRITTFLNLNVPENSINWCVEMADKKRLKYIEDSYGRPRSNIPFIRKGEKRQWKNTLNDIETEYIMNNSKNVLEKLNYL